MLLVSTLMMNLKGQNFFYISLRSLQSVRRLSAIVVTGTVNDM
jgi:hypothetical protein